MTLHAQLVWRPRYLIGALAAWTLAAAALGALDLPRRPYTGLTLDRRSRVIAVEPDSPASRAGMVAGDVIVSDGDVAVTDLRALLRRSRVTIGEARTYVLNRRGQTVRSRLVATGPPVRDVARALALTGVGLCFLGFGLWARRVAPSRCTTLLAFTCATAAIDFVAHPYIPSYPLRLLYLSLLNIVVLWGYASLLHLMMQFPAPKSFLTRRCAIVLLYSPAAVASLLMLMVIGIQADTTGSLVTLFGVAAGACMIGYPGLAIGVLVYNWSTATPEVRVATGLSVVISGVVIGLAPGMLAGLVGSVAPAAALPGAEWYMVTSIALPIGLAVATTRTRHAATTNRDDTRPNVAVSHR